MNKQFTYRLPSLSCIINTFQYFAWFFVFQYPHNTKESLGELEYFLSSRLQGNIVAEHFQFRML